LSTSGWQRAETTRLKKKRVYYLSIEFLIGRLLLDTLTNLRLVEPARRALASMGVDLERLRGAEPDAALGNGGLGRLAACFMDTFRRSAFRPWVMASVYEHGLFEQRLHDGWQQNFPRLARARQSMGVRAPASQYTIGFGGVVEYIGGDDATRAPSVSVGNGNGGALRHADRRLARPPCQRAAAVVGTRGRPHPTRGIQSRRPCRRRAARARAEAISNVLYPNDATLEANRARPTNIASVRATDDRRMRVVVELDGDVVGERPAQPNSAMRRTNLQRREVEKISASCECGVVGIEHVRYRFGAGARRRGADMVA